MVPWYDGKRCNNHLRISSYKIYKLAYLGITGAMPTFPIAALLNLPSLYIYVRK